MPYPDDGDPIKMQILGALRTNMQAIAPPNYHHDVKVAHVYHGDSLVVGRALPAIVIVPTDDRRGEFMSCATVVRDMDVAIVCAIRYTAGSQAWKNEIGFLLADINVAIESDPQLGGLAVFIDSNNDELFDADPTESLAFGQVLIRVNYRHAALNPSSVT